MSESLGQVIDQLSGEDIYSSCISFRKKMEEGKAELGETFEFLAKMSSALLARIRSLLPARVSEPEEDSAEASVREVCVSVASAGAGPGDPAMIARATRVIEECIDKASALYPRGTSGTVSGNGSAGGERQPQPPVEPGLGISALDLARMWFSVKSRADARTKTVLVPKMSFVVHLRRMWRAVLMAAKTGVRVKFSVFAAGHPKWMKVMDFLALLELVRRGRILVWQDGNLGEIEFTARENFTALTGERTASY